MSASISLKILTYLTIPMETDSILVKSRKWVAKKVKAEVFDKASLIAQHNADPSSGLVPLPSSSMMISGQEPRLGSWLLKGNQTFKSKHLMKYLHIYSATR